MANGSTIAVPSCHPLGPFWSPGEEERAADGGSGRRGLAEFSRDEFIVRSQAHGAAQGKRGTVDAGDGRAGLDPRRAPPANDEREESAGNDQPDPH